jgi:hypothetical protein
MKFKPLRSLRLCGEQIDLIENPDAYLTAQFRFNSFFPLSLFCKEPIHNFQIAMQALGSMNLFSDLAAVLK